MAEKKLTQQEVMRRAKNAALQRLTGVLGDWVEIDEYSWASMEEVDGEETWVVCALTAKKPDFDIDGVLEDWAVRKKIKEEKRIKKLAKECKSTSTPMGPSLEAAAREL